MPPAKTRLQRRPGQWRSAADAARPLQGNVFAELQDMAQRLHDKGLDEQAEMVQKAMKVAKTDPERAMEMLHEASRSVAALAPAHGQGLGEIARGLPERAEPQADKLSDDDGIPGLHLH